MDNQAVIRQSQRTVDRLEALRNCGDGAILHDVLVWIAVVNGSIRLAERPGRLSKDEVVRDLVNACAEADTFLIQIARKLHERKLQ